MRNDRSDDTVVVTSAKLSHTDDIALRQRRYVLTQSVRVVCVVLATTLPVPLIWKGVFMLGAVALPWFEVALGAVLVEGGFINNPLEAQLISNSQYRDRLARAVAEGIMSYQRTRPRPSTAPTKLAQTAR